MNRTSFIFKISVVVVLLFYGCGRPEICMHDVKSDFVISENLAVSLSRNALINKGIDVSDMEPVPYHFETPKRLFARGGRNNNSGYVLWHKIGESTLFEYSVSIEKRDDKIYCDAEKTK